MQIFTPRGLKIRLDVEYGFALMKRLYPKVDAFKVLKTTEVLELFPSAAIFIATLIAFAIGLNPVSIAIVAFSSYIVAFLLTFFGLFIIPGLPTLGTAYSYMSGFGVAFVILALVGYFTSGLYGVIAFFIGRISAGIVCYILDFISAKQAFNKTGLMLWSSEKNFLNAYRLHADKLGISNNMTVSSIEMQEENWMDCFEDLARKYPQVISRFR